jgi:hypothetical protein
MPLGSHRMACIGLLGVGVGLGMDKPISEA